RVPYHLYTNPLRASNRWLFLRQTRCRFADPYSEGNTNCYRHIRAWWRFRVCPLACSPSLPHSPADLRLVLRVCNAPPWAAPQAIVFRYRKSSVEVRLWHRQFHPDKLSETARPNIADG